MPVAVRGVSEAAQASGLGDLGAWQIPGQYHDKGSAQACKAAAAAAGPQDNTAAWRGDGAAFGPGTAHPCSAACSEGGLAEGSCRRDSAPSQADPCMNLPARPAAPVAKQEQQPACRPPSSQELLRGWSSAQARAAAGVARARCRCYRCPYLRRRQSLVLRHELPGVVHAKVTAFAQEGIVLAAVESGCGTAQRAHRASPRPTVRRRRQRSRVAGHPRLQAIRITKRARVLRRAVWALRTR